MSRYQELTSPGIVLTFIVGGVSGGAIGLALDGFIAHKPVLAVLAAFLAIVVSTLIRHFTIFASIRGAGPGPGRLAIPGAMLINAVIAACVGGGVAYLASVNLLSPPPSAWIGCLSGVLGCVVMELLMIGYRAQRQGSATWRS
jgi:hypothetical protein